MMRDHPLRRAACCAAFLLLTACGRQVSLENYNKLRVGQSFDEVRQILGDPARCDETLGVRVCTWGDAERGVSVSFAGGQVLLHSAKNLR